MSLFFFFLDVEFLKFPHNIPSQGDYTFLHNRIFNTTLSVHLEENFKFRKLWLHCLYIPVRSRSPEWKPLAGTLVRIKLKGRQRPRICVFTPKTLAVIVQKFENFEIKGEKWCNYLIYLVSLFLCFLNLKLISPVFTERWEAQLPPKSPNAFSNCFVQFLSS